MKVYLPACFTSADVLIYAEYIYMFPITEELYMSDPHKVLDTRSFELFQ